MWGSDVSEKVAQAPISGPADLSQGSARQHELRENRLSLLDEPLKPADSGTFVTPAVCLTDQEGQIKGVAQAKAAELSRRHLRIPKVAMIDRPRESAVCAPLRRHS